MAKRKDVGDSKSEPNAVIAYRAPQVPAAVPTLFKAEPAADEPAMAETLVESEAAADAPVLPRAATLDEVPPTISVAPSVVPDEAATAPAAGPVADKPASRAGRFTLLAASVALAASIGAVAGSLGHAEFQRQFAVAAPRADVPEDVRMLKDTLAQLRANVKSLSDNMAAMRVSMAASSSTINGQLGKIAETIDRGDRRAAAAAGPAETTGSIASPNGGEVKPPARPPIVEGWVVRKVYDGAALVEGRYGIVEVEPGTILPGLGRIQEIKRQDGHWVVVTAKGLIMPVH
jgi:hypothetical protein